MDFPTAVRTCLRKYATFSGRARRAEFWWFVLFNLLGSLALGLVDAAVFGAQPGAASVFQPLFSLAMLLPNIAVSVRRLHDTDRTGWWYLLVLLPVIGIIVLIVWYVQRGTDGPNRFGPDPLAGAGPGAPPPGGVAGGGGSTLRDSTIPSVRR
jgi:uncharacterized membrane protein YhaH (DUF805 family)